MVNINGRFPRLKESFFEIWGRDYLNIKVDSLITFLITWGTPTIMMMIAYLKMSKGEKNDVKKDFSSLRFIFTIDSWLQAIFFLL